MNSKIKRNIFPKSKDKQCNRLIHSFVLLLFLAFTNNLFAQDAKVSLSLQNVPFKQFCNEIEKQTNYQFSYRDADVKDKGNISISVKNESVASVLKSILPSQKLQYNMRGNKIILTPLQQQQTVTSGNTMKVAGIVKDAAGEPLIGVTVSMPGNEKVRTVTGLSGDFSLNNVPANARLQFSYIGYRTQELTAKNTLSVILQEDAEALEEVVVVGYAVQKKVNLSGAVSTVSMKQLEDRPVLNVGQALQGTVANLNVTVGSGQAIDSPSFNIRGTTSLNGGNPLVVIDGVISDNGTLNRMNPTDIANISVLKDAASSAIYGSRAAFGVILVTTKTGQNEKLTVNYNNNFSTKKITRMPDIITDPYDVAVTRNKMGEPWYRLYNDEQLAYAKRVSEDPSTPPHYLNPDGTYSYFGQTDWLDEAYKNAGFSMAHSIDISGKTDKLTYYFSGGYNYDGGMIRYGTDTYHRYNLRSKLDFKLSSRWNISNNTSITTSDYEAPTSLGSSYYWEINRISPLDVVRNPDGTWTQQGSSVLGIMEEGGRWKKDEININTQFNTRFDFIKNVLYAQGTFAFNTQKNNEDWHYLPVAYYDGPGRNPRYRNEVTSVNTGNTNSKHIMFDAYLTFTKTFAKKHYISAMIGFNQEESRWVNRTMDRKDLISPSLPSIGLATGDQNVYENISTWALRGGYGRFNYIFDDKYIIEFNGRYDGTSRFPKDSRFVFNPSGSLAWVISKEKFFEPLKNVISFFKLRASYGTLGNQDVSDYAYLATMGSGKTGRIFDGKQPVYVSAPGLVAGDLTWEKVSTSDIGIDINLFNNRLTFTGDIYVRQTKDMLTKGQTLPAVLGVGVPQQNAADLKTQGWDLTINWKDQAKVAGKPLNYSFGFNIGDSRAFITKFENPKGLLGDYYEGWEMGDVWGLTTLGFFTSPEDIKNHADQTPVTSYPGTRPIGPGDLKFEDRNGDGVIDSGSWTLADHGDYHLIGNTRSRYTFGLTGAADWNGFDVSCFFQGVGKKDYFPSGSDTFFWGCYYEPWSNITKGNFVDHWTEENPNAYFPRLKSYLSYVGGADGAISQTRYKQNAAYIRMKNLTVGYTLPTQVLQKAGIKRVRVFFSGDNLFEVSGLYKYYKVDPEGLGGQKYPLQRSYSFGLNVTL